MAVIIGAALGWRVGLSLAVLTFAVIALQARILRKEQHRRLDGEVGPFFSDYLNRREIHVAVYVCVAFLVALWLFTPDSVARFGPPVVVCFMILFGRWLRGRNRD